MFGYLTINENALEDAERARYLQVYCGVCHALHERSGQLSRLALSHDLTFMALTLLSLYEPTERIAESGCPLHPVKKRAHSSGDMVDYAADMTVALMYFKCLDDWNDDENRRARAFARSLEPHYRVVKQRWPRQCSTIERGLDEISRIERTWSEQRAKDAGTSDTAAASSPAASNPAAVNATTANPSYVKIPGPDDAANFFGIIMAEIFAINDDVWADTLHAFGFHLGRFVYLMDAAVDLPDDLKSGSYNPFAPCDNETAAPDVDMLRDILRIDIAHATSAFERLPLVQDIHLLRSVLYSGIWARFNKAYPTDQPEASARAGAGTRSDAPSRPVLATEAVRGGWGE